MPEIIKSSRKKSVILLLVVAALLGGGWHFFAQTSSSSKDQEEFTWVNVTKGEVAETVTAQGKLEPKEYVDVGAQVSGQLKELYVDIGDVVKKGDKIAEIDPRVYESRVQASKAGLATLQAQLKEQQAQVLFNKEILKRNERLIKLQAVSQEALEESQTQVNMSAAKAKSIMAQIDQANSGLKEDETNLSYTKIFAPMDGTVVLLTTRKGQTVNANQSAPVIVQLANLDVMTVKAQVAEADVMRLKTGMNVSFTTLGNLERKWHGTLQQIYPSPEVINDVVLYNALVDVDNKDRQLMSGMSTQMFFELGNAQDVITIPVTALGKRMPKEDNDKGPAYQVRFKADDSNKKSLLKIIHIGLLSRVNVEVTDGLKEGDRVAIPNHAPSDSNRRSGGRPPRGPRL